jgi:hypothetical protein
MSAMTAGLEPKYIRIKNWQRYQHYRGQIAPPWIKLHRSLLRDQAFMALPELTQWRLVKSWLAASEAGGVLPNDLELLTDLLRIRDRNVTRSLRKRHDLVNTLSSSGFWILSDTDENSRAEEKRRDIEEKKQKHCVPQAKKPPAGHHAYTTTFENLWANYPKTNGSKLEAFKAWTAIGLESDPRTLELALRRLSEYRLCPQWKNGYVPHAATWLRQRRWETEPDTTERGGNRGKTIPEQNQEVLDRLLADPTV